METVKCVGHQTITIIDTLKHWNDDHIQDNSKPKCGTFGHWLQKKNEAPPVHRSWKAMFWSLNGNWQLAHEELCTTLTSRLYGEHWPSHPISWILWFHHLKLWHKNQHYLAKIVVSDSWKSRLCETPNTFINFRVYDL